MSYVTLRDLRQTSRRRARIVGSLGQIDPPPSPAVPVAQAAKARPAEASGTIPSWAIACVLGLGLGYGARRLTSTSA
jgi:hypothetical protein